MNISIVVAASINNVIGINNKLPWYLPSDLKHFKDLTSFKTIIMGRKTFESIGKALPNRVNIVVSSNQNLKSENVHFADSFTTALDIANKYNKRKRDEVFIIGGEKLFAEALPRVNNIYLTRIYKEIEGDAFIPSNLLDNFSLNNASVSFTDADQDISYKFLHYTRT